MLQTSDTISKQLYGLWAKKHGGVRDLLGEQGALGGWGKKKVEQWGWALGIVRVSKEQLGGY